MRAEIVKNVPRHVTAVCHRYLAGLTLAPGRVSNRGVGSPSSSRPARTQTQSVTAQSLHHHSSPKGSRWSSTLR